ncbi:MAG: hypothetical protein HEQ21_12280 [Blastomonas sp.]|uniref:helix-turn-helix transcriptional regulator n=1 Tax=unclassified Blastomonas TaxID=2626550 RepID=UPI0006B9D095|nr:MULTISPECIES: hypothetical protein [unclassified Blastomonas]KPF75049.1 hypothetical protein IP68_10535 [Blastomonas sp. AAP25]MCO5793591.1 hypothetical protein [Blastomonas sp.]
MIVISNQFDKLDEYIAEAALGNISWSQSLKSMSEIVGAEAMTMDLILGDGQSITSLGAYGFDQTVVDAYAEHYAQVDPRLEYVQAYGKNGVIFDDEIQQSSLQGHNSEFWSWLETANAPRNAAVLVLPCVDNARIVMAVHRDKSSSSQNGLMGFFTEFYHKFNMVNSMLRMDIRNGGATDRPFTPLRNIDSFQLCVDENLMVVDAGGMTRYLLAMTGLARLGDEGQLGALPADFQAALMNVLHNLPPHDSTPLAHKGDLTDSVVHISAVVGEDSTRLASITVTYVRHPAEPEKVFMGAFGLTRRQAELLKFLRHVYSLDDAANLMSISKNTARVFLAQIFDRTKIRNRIDLLRLADRFS